MASGKTLRSTIEISGVLSPSLQAAINAAVDRLEDMAAETLDSADAASRLVAEMSAQEDILKNLQKAYAGYVASGEEGSDQAQELADKIRDVAGELDENRDTLKAAENAARSLTDAQDDTADAYGDSAKAADASGDAALDAGDDAEKSSGGWTILKDAIGDLVADAISSAIDAFKELATEGDTTLGMLSARTGATGAEIEGFGNVMDEVYNAGYGESLGDVSEKLSTVISMTDDLDNASLAKITKNAIALEDVFGFDTTESMRAVNSLMDQFGITADEAFNLVVQGAQNGLNQNDDLLDTINEYSVQFKDAGYSADDMFNMLVNGTATGTWSVDKLGDAVKEFNIRMSDGTANDYLADLGVDVDSVMEKFNNGGADAQEAIGTVMDAVLECDDATLQYQAGVGLFGTMWEDLGADTVASLMDTQGAISRTADAMGKMDSAAYDTLETSLSKLGRTVKAEVVQPIAEKLTPSIKNAVDTVTEKVGPAVDWALDHLPQIGIALGVIGAIIAAMQWTKIVTGVTKAVGAFQKMGAAFTAIPGPVLAIIAIVAALAAGFVYLWKTNDDFRESMTALWGELQGTFSELGATFGDMLTQLAPLLSDLLTTALTSIAQILQTLLPLVVQIISEVLPVCVELFAQLLPIIMQVAQTVLPMVAQIISQLLPVILQIVQAVLPVLLQLLQTVLPILMQIIQGVLPLVLQLISAILPVVMQIVNAVLPILVQILGFLTPILTMIVSLLTPILNLILAVVSPILNLIFSAITPLIGILTTLIGTVLKPIIPIIEMVAEVISGVLGGAIAAIQPIIKALTAVFQGLIDFITGVFTGNWSKAWNGVVKIFGGLWDGLVAIVKAPINGVIGLINGAIGALNKVSVKIPDWVPGFGGQTFGVNIPKIPMLASGGFTDGVSIAGEAGMEAVISFDPAYHSENVGIWARAGQLLGVLSEEEEGAGLTGKAGELLALDDFSLGSLADGTSISIYYDFSGFTWSPQIQTNGSDEDEDTFMAQLRAHEAEFFDWLEEFVRMREVAQYA